MHKEASKSKWTGQELYVCARLLEDIHAYPESARYYFALYSSKGMNDAQERALAGLTNLLLTAPETAIRLGSGELSMYRDIATMDQGPGYLNGILSLILNTTAPAANSRKKSSVPSRISTGRVQRNCWPCSTRSFPTHPNARNCTPGCWSFMPAPARAKL